jgi:sugar/nucleoside kinase (ribokinase family)
VFSLIRRWFARSPRILVIGSCHLDVFADSTATTRIRLDKIGTIIFSTGGTAYNIAVNLSLNHFRVSILTVIKELSIISDVLKFRLAQSRVSTKFVIQIPTQHESGFVAHREDGHLLSAVTSTLIDTIPLVETLLRKAIAAHDLVICDCNASSQQIAEVMHICMVENRPLFLAAVSDSKAHRLLAVGSVAQGRAAALMCMNTREAVAVGINVGDFAAKKEYRAEILNKFFTKEMVITKGADGLCYAQSEMACDEIEPPPTDHIVSTSGAGDAVLCAVIDWKLRGEGAQSSLKQTIHRYVMQALMSEGSTIGSPARTDHFLILRGRKPFIVRFGEKTVVFNYISLISFIAGLLGLWLAWIALPTGK